MERLDGCEEGKEKHRPNRMLRSKPLQIKRKHWKKMVDKQKTGQGTSRGVKRRAKRRGALHRPSVFIAQFERTLSNGFERWGCRIVLIPQAENEATKLLRPSPSLSDTHTLTHIPGLTCYIYPFWAVLMQQVDWEGLLLWSKRNL